ncbi:MAG: nucleoid occlusion protein [Chitinophagales bacterium]
MKPWERLIGKANKNNPIIYIKIDEIHKGQYQPRQVFDQEEMRDLARSIQEVGLIQPIAVRKSREGYELIAGERRWRACQMAGWVEVPAVIVDMDDEKAAIAGLVENVQRKDLNYFEEAMAYAQMIGEFGLTQEEIAAKVGRSQSAVANKLRLLKLNEEIKARIAPDVITERHARALLKLNSYETQVDVLNQIYEKELTVKETDELIDLINKNISREISDNSQKKRMSVIIKDARIYVNTIRETVRRAKNSGVNVSINEERRENELEITIRIPIMNNK